MNAKKYKLGCVSVHHNRHVLGVYKGFGFWGFQGASVIIQIYDYTAHGNSGPIVATRG
jgi:hypothetical protein